MHICNERGIEAWEEDNELENDDEQDLSLVPSMKFIFCDCQ